MCCCGYTAIDGRNVKSSRRKANTGCIAQPESNGTAGHQLPRQYLELNSLSELPISYA